MTDREMLEYAAKAAGVDLRWQDEKPHIGDWLARKWWNPLTDDGDALRLAVKLNMGISIPIHKTIRADVICFQNSAVSARQEGDDPYAATRRAIVRAAAAIGKAM